MSEPTTDGVNELIVLRQSQHNAQMEEIAEIIAKAVRPWIGEDAEYSVGMSEINKEMAMRAGRNAAKALQKAGKL